MTINKLNLPAKANAVQTKINEIIDNFPTNEVFVAEYDVTSYSDILSEYNLGKLIFLTSDYLIFGTGEQGTYLIPLEKYDEKTDSTAEFVFSAINNTTQKKYIINSSNTWSMETSVFANATLSNVSSISNNSAVKTALDGKADTTLSNVSSIDSNSAVQTALDGKVSKSGDTMTGDLTILNDNGFFAVKSSFDSTTTSAPSEFINLGTLAMYDTNDKFTGFVENSFNTNNTVRTAIGARRIINGVNKSANLYLDVDSSGNASCTFPNTTCVDGQWTTTYQDIISSDTSVNGSTDLTKRVAVPNDGYVYEAMIMTRATTTATSGQLLRVAIGTNQLSQDVLVCGLRTRTNSTMEVQATNIVPIKGVAMNSTNLTIVRGSGINGNINVMRLIAYRRVGTNS